VEDRGSTQCLGISNRMRPSQQHQEVEAQILLDIQPTPAARIARWIAFLHSLRKTLERVMDSTDSEPTHKFSHLESTCKNSTLPTDPMGRNVKAMVIQTKVLRRFQEKRDLLEECRSNLILLVATSA
jgi:hypothetical protein